MHGKGEGKRLQDLRARVATVDDGLAIDSEFLVTLAQRLAVRLLLPKMPILPEAVDVPTAVDDQCATCAKFLPRNRRVPNCNGNTYWAAVVAPHATRAGMRYGDASAGGHRFLDLIACSDRGASKDERGLAARAKMAHQRERAASMR
jgi:hypothetical protein